MQKNELLMKDGKIIRILAVDGDDVFYFECKGTKASMPKWCHISELEGYEQCTEDELRSMRGMEIIPEDDLDNEKRNKARQRYMVIAPVLGCLEDEKLRTQIIEMAAKEHHVTKETVRNYLKMYLTYNALSALLPKHRTTKEKPLTEDEKNMRWAINKFVYSRKKNSLNTAYKLMLKEKYTDGEGNLL